MKTYLLATVIFLAAMDGIAATGTTQNVFEGSACAAPETPIDKFVFRKLSKLGIKPSICSDAVFVRRAYLDVIGTLPTAKEAREFMESQDKSKRAALIDRLLERPEFADYWAMKWSDLLRVKAEFPVNLWPNAAQAYHRWIRASIRDNKPYDQFVREMLTSNGSNFRVGPVNFYRAIQNKTPDGIATAVALTFMGTRADLWPTNDLMGMSAFFAQVGYKPTREWKEEVVFWDPSGEIGQATNVVVQPTNTIAQTTNTAAHTTNIATRATNIAAQATNSVAQTTNTAQVAAQAVPVVPQTAVFPDGRKIKLPPDQDPREVFADWLITPKNPWFTRNIANRVWSWMLGRGIIHEPDDIRPDNPPTNPALLGYLEKELINARYDLKHLYRLILNSRTYQLSSIMPARKVSGGEANFAFYPLRQLDAEVLIDAINGITGAKDLYTSPIPEPFTFIPENKPAIALPDGSITSAFLELFGKPARATGMENERINRSSPPQRMHMLNSSHIQRKLVDGAKSKAIIDIKRNPREITEDLYLTILSRFPTDDEMKAADAYVKAGVAKGRDAWVDIAWALINTDEFLYRH